MSELERREKDRALRMAISLGIAVVLLLFVGTWLLSTIIPEGIAWANSVFEPGLGLKTAAMVAAAVSVLVLIIFAVSAGDGLIGEFQFMIPGFFLFFLFFWLMTAWVF